MSDKSKEVKRAKRFPRNYILLFNIFLDLHISSFVLKRLWINFLTKFVEGSTSRK